MMSRQAILPLDPAVVGKIAAGEVVERPALAIKELVENSIDAGAASITVQIRDGGLSYFRVTDNGAGIDPADINMAFSRHATSKIKSEQDLASICTLGFRGEALHSIAAVSKVEMVTRRAGLPHGVKAVVEGGIIRSMLDAPSPEGTSIIVRDLFFNTPARKKFLRKPVTEAGLVSDLVTRLIIARPDISFRLQNEEKKALHSPGNGRLCDALLIIWGGDAHSKAVEVSGSAAGCAVEGFIGVGELAKSNRSMQTFVLNGRFIRNAVLTKALEEGCKDTIMSGKHPICALHLTMPFEAVDVNVHPNKLEVRFSDERALCAGIANVIHNALKADPLLSPPKLPIVPDEDETKRIEMQARQARISVESVSNLRETGRLAGRLSDSANGVSVSDDWVNDVMNRQTGKVSDGTNAIIDSYGFTDDAMDRSASKRSERPGTPHESNDAADHFSDRPASNLSDSANAPYKSHDAAGQPKRTPSSDSIAMGRTLDQQKMQTEHSPQPEHAPQQEHLFQLDMEDQPLSIIGVAWRSYIIAEMGETVYFIDQHAAHERILYERMKKALDEKTVSQFLLAPAIIQLTHREHMATLSSIEDLSACGFEIEDFGDRSVQVRAVPMILGVAQAKDFFVELTERMAEVRSFPTAEQKRDALIQMACKKAVKAGDLLPIQSIEGLIRQMRETGTPPTCPHGRPLVVRIEKADVDRRFRRT